MEKYMIMKRILKGLSAFAAIIVALTACDSSADQTTYDGPEYVMFSDTMTYFPVSNSQDYFNVPVGSTVACSYDRTYAVEVDDQNSTAVEDLHFTIESNSVTIKAGELATNVRVKGIYENIEPSGSLSLKLRLILKEGQAWDLYGTQTRVEIIKSCPFDINAFTGYCKVRSTFFRDYMSPVSMRVLKSEVDAQENTIVLHDLFYKGYDIRIKFDPTDPLKPFVEMDDQVLGSTAEAFGTIYGNGKLMVAQPTAYVSYFNVCQGFVLQYITVYVENVGTVGTFVNVIEWISDQEAEQLIKQGY